MIELAFGEGLAGSLQLAKSYRKGERVQGASATLGEPVKISKTYWTGETMPGDISDVSALTLALEIGALDEGDDGRLRILRTLYGAFPGVPEDLARQNRITLDRLDSAASAGETIRMWLDPDDPGDRCGLYFTCRRLRDTDARLSCIRIPREGERGDDFVEYRSANDCPPEALGEWLPLTQAIPPQRKLAYAAQWDRLCAENAPLRANLNGQLCSVPITFYDDLLRAHRPAGEFVLARWIGKTLIDSRGVCDRWLFLRTQAMIEAGELTEVAPANESHPYSAILRAANRG